jgi:hypothetical protein
MCIFLAFIFSMFMRSGSAPAPESGFRTVFPVLILAHFCTMIIMIGLLVFYIVHVFKNPALAGDKRTLWAVVLFFGGIVAMPVYWFLYVWRIPDVAVSPPQAEPPRR